ncbi:DMT family transporter [Halosquirtibacter xylanolyticus]|uniref:DMT family transporter n=1 Tax=Halosquirtibacter xylanolyticus TaxID=3374599 RepID=UPI0037495BE6|nr:DMT family transporter [Prolixibacteraceae bacterium]
MKSNYLLNSNFMAIVACLLWSTAFVGIKIGIQYTPPLQFAGIRFMLSGLIIFPFIPHKKRIIPSIKKHWKYMSLLALMQTVIHYALFYQGVRLMPSSVSAIIIGMGPMFVMMVAHFTSDSDKMTKDKLISVALGIIGVICVVLGKGGKMANTTYLMTVVGVVLLLLTNLNSGFVNVLVKSKTKSMPPLILTMYTMFVGGVCLFIMGLLTEGFAGFVFPKPYYYSLAWLSFLSAAAFSLWFTVLQRPEVKVSEINIWKFLIPVSGALLSWTILPDESPSILSLIGMGFTAAALIWMNFASKRSKKEV